MKRVASEPGLSHTLCPQRKVLCIHLSMVCPKNRILGGWNLTHNGDPRVGKLIFENLKMSNFPWVAPLLPHPGANITQDSTDL